MSSIVTADCWPVSSTVHLHPGCVQNVPLSFSAKTVTQINLWASPPFPFPTCPPVTPAAQLLPRRQELTAASEAFVAHSTLFQAPLPRSRSSENRRSEERRVG